MKNAIVFILLFSASIFSTNAFSQKLSGAHQKKVDALFASKSVVYFKFPVSSMQEATALSKIIKIDSNKGMMFFAHATKDQFSKFIVKNYAYTIVPHAGSKAKPKGKAKPKPATKTAPAKVKK